ncbi:hypothetical protein [Actinoplanes siamensis]|uniref:hypothetical protein n=1 Tax=Actinoplanes siamensis TaxID=1223317 RepID=UPI001944C214|nr:hypothetical protein [Actinoplanes siamensis]
MDVALVAAPARGAAFAAVFLARGRAGGGAVISGLSAGVAVLTGVDSGSSPERADRAAGFGTRGARLAAGRDAGGVGDGSSGVPESGFEE